MAGDGYLPGYASEEGLGDSGTLLLRFGAAFAPVPSWAGPDYAAVVLLGLLTLALAVVRLSLPADPAGVLISCWSRSGFRPWSRRTAIMASGC